MKGKLLAFVVAVLSVATIGVVQLQVNAAVDNSRDCDSFAVVRCGMMSASEMRTEYDTNNASPANGTTTRQGDIQRIFGAMGISRGELSGNFHSGVVYQDGRVVVGGKTVATGAVMAARGLGGSPISGTGASRVSVRAMGSAQTALVKLDSNGRFKFAVMKPCGNPVSAQPTQPQPKPSAKCEGLTVKKIERTKFRFDASASVKDGAKVKSYTFVVSRGGKVVHTKTVTTNNLKASYTYSNATAGNYSVRVTVNTTVGPKTGPECVKPFEIKKPPVTPSALCKSLTVTPLERTKFRFDARAEVANGATVSSYVFQVLRGNDVIATQTVTSSALTASYTYDQTTAGDYVARVTVNTSEGPKTGPDCQKPFKVTPPKTPGVDIVKYVENEKYKRVGVNVEYDYQIAVTNTGDVDLKNVVVTDTPEDGITLVSASVGSIEDNTWTYTIPELKIGEKMDFTLTAKVPVFLAGKLTNTVCVDAPEVPGNPDDCDEADVDVPEEEVPGKIEVCVLEDRTIQVIDEDDFNPNLHSRNLSDCEEVAPPVTELPETGPTETAVQIIGAMSLVGASAYYMASRRNLA